MVNWFEELSSRRREWVEVTRKNNFDEGIRHSTVDKYPDPVHFVYELLQNAEDQGASEVQFQLFTTHLIFMHNGKPFTEQDVENITGIGNSNKPQETNKIGRFGIGFKSVFAITERPEIYSVLEEKPFAFAIEHLVVPTSIPAKPEELQQFKTRFLFPFISGQEESLYRSIKERLSSLDLETLLFLQNLALVEWQAETDHGVYLREVKEARYELCGESSKDGRVEQRNANYLVFARNVQISESDRELDVRLAFRLDEREKIIPEERSPNLAVYFPTEQPTGLKFRLHGPFLLTDNRTHIKNSDDTNNRLIQECAFLLCESIQKVKELSLLTVDFFSLLPLRKENIPEQFQALYSHLLELFQQHPLLPTANGTFANASQVRLARGADLRELINERQLALLYGSVSSPLYWLPAEITSDRMPDLYHYLSGDLQIDVIDPEAFVRNLDKPFLTQQTDEWLIKLYIFLSKQPSLKPFFKLKPLLRLEDNSHVTSFKSILHDGNKTPNAYLLREGESKFPLVKKALLVDDAVYSFLKEIGLPEPDIVDEVMRFILPPYKKGQVALDDESRYRQDLNCIQEALRYKDHHIGVEFLNRLNKIPFLQATNAKTSERTWKAPCDVYRKTPELLTWFEGNKDAWFIDEVLSGSLCGDLNIRDSLQPKAKAATGNMGYVNILDSHGHHKRGLHRFDSGASLDGLQHALDFMTLDKAQILWRILLEYRYLIKGVVEISTQQNFGISRREEAHSFIGSLCCRKAWLPDKNLVFHVPQELFLMDLPEEFEKSTDEAHELATKLKMRKAEELQLAEKLGIPPDAISVIQRNHETFLVWYKQQQRKPLLPSSIASDPSRRREKGAEVARATEVKSYSEVTMNRRTSAGYGEPKTYLRSHNTNEEGQLICQLCDQSMPFRLPDGEYFEAYQYIDIAEKEYVANHLALCPNCAAEFKHACRTDASERVKRILGIKRTDDEENLAVYIDMPVHRRLRFTQRHLIDLQEAIKDWRNADSNINVAITHDDDTG